MNYYSLEKPMKWRAGYVGKDKKPFFFDCADCGAKEPEIAGFAGSGPKFENIGVLKAEGAFYKLAMFCRECFAKRLAENAKAA